MAVIPEDPVDRPEAPASPSRVGAPTYAAVDATVPVALDYAAGVSRSGRYRWLICAMLFVATTINYIDRQVLAVLSPELTRKFQWDEATYGYIIMSFQLSYAIGLAIAGGLIDRFGTRVGFAVAIAFWSLAGMATAGARSALGFAVARFALGLGESGNFPAAVKTTAEWFPRSERALATGIFNSGSNVGAILVPMFVPIVYAAFGWQAAFLACGTLGLIWLVPWLLIYRPPAEHPRVSPAELAWINQDPPETTQRVPWASLLPLRQTWAFAFAKFCTDPVWWFWLYWLPKYFDKTYGLSITGLALPLVVIYVAADVGSIGGGYLSSSLIKRGWSVNAARKTAMLACALCVLPMTVAGFVHEKWVSVAFISLAAAAHQGWSANLFTLVSDMYPKRAVGSVVGIGGMAGAIGGLIVAPSVGNLLKWNGGNYVPLLIVAGCAYVVTLAILHAIVPRLEPADLAEPPATSRP